ncbi:MerR family transcriptional regulator [Spirosoma endbachense]|uniref:MerR family transcriptional regulator n=1 Tax=Spirosoma endbachense TaxID=2666025 RepID=A0A6P1W0G1_9BACT|nr:MerR family transcriptional regulator [Spirosoma endbachense]QHV97469.1 MerR family transcriptional regulator [Spirosoma endbachense]
MLISELSQKSGFPKHTIRYYEKIGQLTLNRKDRQNTNYKEYPTSILTRLRAIQSLKQAGFALPEIRHTVLPTSVASLTVRPNS